MKRNQRFIKKALSLLLVLALTATYLPVAWQATAVTGNAYGQTGNKIADASTVNEWKDFFDISDPDNLDTTYAGGVWTDKSVFNSVADYVAATDENEAPGFPLTIDNNNFLVALSGIASAKSVEGYSALPSDTILVLDLSASMITNQAVAALVQSANDAITKLQELNANNRVGVVAYSGRSTTGISNVDTAEVILPLGRYTPGLDGSNKSAYLVSSWETGSGRYATSHTGVKVANGVTGTIARGVTSTFSTNNNKDASGGTYIQNGLYQAWQMFSQVEDTAIETGIQAGVSRVPVMVLMSDGAPTAATTDYRSVGASNVGNGSAAYATTGTAFLTQLTASWVRDNMEKKYGEAPLFYTLGLGVGSNTAANNLLNPSRHTDTDSYWSTFRGKANSSDKTMRVTITDNQNASITYTAPVGNSWSEDYVTEYFPASNAEGMTQAFSNIVKQIIIQSLYYPTMVESGNTIHEDGFLYFEDFIGKNMEVKAIKGVQLGDTLYTGQTMARLIHTGGMGTVENPTDVGNNLVWSIQKRLSIPNIQDVRSLLANAYSSGQLSYNPDTGAFSNYIGWYADENEVYLGFWDGKDDSAAAAVAANAAGAKYAIKSYLFYDAVGEGHRKTDMMYATVQVRTTLRATAGDAAEVGDIQVVGRLPASLIPLIEYNVSLDGTDVMKPTAISVSGATAPSRLLYEVGLHSDIDLLDIPGTAPDPLQTDADGNYIFYSNQWHDRHNDEDSDTSNDFSYATNKITQSWFEPSFENERYYYNYNTPVYVDTNGTLYTGSAKPAYSHSNTYYHRFITYYKENGVVRAQYEYEPISEHVLSGTGQHDHLTRQDDNSWVVNKGTLHHYFADYLVSKTANETGTVDVSFMPFTHDLEVSATETFHVDFYLGNNGKLTLDPTEGIKITKTADNTLTDKTVDYSFTVTTDASFNETLRLVKQDAAGNRTESSVTFTGGSATVTLKHGEAAWILGATMAGKTFTVRENYGEGYVVSSVNGAATAQTATLPVTGNQIPVADFINTRQQTGSVIIGKGVVSNIPAHQNKEFSFTVSIDGAALVPGRTYSIIRSDGQSFSVIAGGSATVPLKHNQYMTLSGLPVGTTVSATEADYSADGFTVNTATQSTTVAADTTQYLNYQNTYSADPVRVDSSVSIVGTKHFDSDTPWNADFRFKLDRFIYADNSYEPVRNAGTDVTATVSYNGETGGDKNFHLAFDAQTYTATGTYYYRITEVVDSDLESQGIIFDRTPAYFSVVVADDGQGSLYISDVVAGTDATVTGNAQNGWTVSASFTNTYTVSGAAELILNMKKLVTSNYGVTIPPAGFQFALYEADADWNVTATAPVKTSSVTAAGGLSDLTLLYNDAVNDLGHYYYVLKEIVPAQNDKIPGVTYSQQKYGVYVDVDHSAGLFTLQVRIYDLNGSAPALLTDLAGRDTGNSSASHLVQAELSTPLTFTNTYTPAPVEVPVLLHKELRGADLADHAFRYEIVEVDANGNPDGNPATYALTAQTTHTITVSTTGTRYWRIREVIPSGAVNNRYEGVTYDPAVYTVKVETTPDNQSGLLVPAVTIQKDGQTVPAITFENRYTADPVTALLEGTKTLSGDIRKLQANAYYFELLDSTGTVVQTVGNETPIGDYDAFFTFAALTFDAPGTYSYTIREKLHPEANATNDYTVHGVKYDTRTYPVTVQVTDPGKGQLAASVTYGNLPAGADIPAFKNAYSVSPTSYTIRGSKALTGDDIANHTGAKAFRFDLYAASWNTAEQTVTQGALLGTAENDATGAFSFSPADISALNFSHIGAYRFILKEQIPANSDPLMVYDAATFYYEVDVTDNLLGSLTATAKVTRVDDRGNRTEVSDTSVVFSNTLKPVPVSVPLGGIKTFNLNLEADTFSFDLYQALKGADGSVQAVGDPILTAWNQANGNFRFQEKLVVDNLSGLQSMTSYLTFDTAGTYYFVVKENIPAGADANHVLNGVTYDATVYTVTVTVTESVVSGRTTLSYNMQVTGGAGGQLIFANTYDASAQSGLIVRGEKILTGRDLKDGEFSFGLYNATVDANGTVTAGTLLEEVKNAGKNFTFSELTYRSYTDAGRHYYLLREQLPAGADANGTLGAITYDLKQYLIFVDVTDNGDGTLSVSDPAMVLIEDGKVSQTVPTEVFFRNVYTPPAPETGDHSQPVFWAVLLSLSVLGMGAVLTLGRKKAA